MGCRFCLTARQGLRRNLLPSEITGQMTMLRRHTPEGPEIKNIVLMGMGGTACELRPHPEGDPDPHLRSRSRFLQPENHRLHLRHRTH